MHRTLALVLLLLTTWLVGLVEDGPQDRVLLLALGVTLIAAVLAGTLFERLRLPKVTGYLIFGMVCGPSVANLVTRPMARELLLFNGMAVVLIAFMAGLELNFRRLRPRLGTMLRVGGTNILVTNLGLFAVIWLLWPWLPIAPEATGPVRLALVMLLAAVLSCSSPSVAMAVIAESRASGQLTELVMAVVVLADIALLVVFTLVMQVVRAVFGADLNQEVALLTRLAWSLLGSMAFGFAMGGLLALYLRFVGRERAIVLLGLFAVMTVAGEYLHFEPILSGLGAGLILENVTGAGGDQLGHDLERSALPVLVVFFVAAGASLDLAAVATVGGVALVLSAARMGLLRVGTGLGARWSRVEPPVDRLVWMGLVSQAGVTLGLAGIVAHEFPAWGVPLHTLVVALIALHQLMGPLLFRVALGRVNEVGRAADRSFDVDLAAVPSRP
jgi:Kef-type K+ transport system membrane component KefB